MLGPFHLHQGLVQGLLLRAAVRSTVSGAEYMPHTCWQAWRTQSQSFTQGISIRQHGDPVHSCPGGLKGAKELKISGWAMRLSADLSPG